MKVYMVWETEHYEHSGVVKIYMDEEKAKEFIKNRDKMTGCSYHIEVMEVEM